MHILQTKQNRRKKKKENYNKKNLTMQKMNKGTIASKSKRRIKTVKLQDRFYSPDKIISNMESLIKKAIWKSSGTAELVGCCFILLQTKISSS